MTKKLIALFIALVMLAVPFSTIVSAEKVGTFSVGVGDEPNNANYSFETAQEIYSDFTVTGKLESETEMDYYKITVPIDGRINFWLGNIPAGCDYDLIVFNEEEMMEWVSTTENDYEEILGQSVTADDVYYIVVGSYSGYSSLQYSLRVRIYLDSYTYFPQRPGNIYNPDDLNTIWTYNIGEMKSLYNHQWTNESSPDWEKQSWYWNLYKYGCVASSIAMVLSNMGLSTQYAIPNILNASNGNVPTQIISAHPYAVMWANSNHHPSDIGTPSQISVDYSNPKYIADTSTIGESWNRDMAMLKREQVAKLFDVTIYGYKVDGFTEEAKMNAIANLISKNPEGICLSFIKEENGIVYPHTIVLTASTYNGTLNEYIPSKTSTGTGSTYAPGVQQYSISMPIETGKGAIMEEFLYENCNTRAITQLDRGDEFIVYDPIPDSKDHGETTLSNCYTGRAYDWSHLFEIMTIDAND